MLMQRFITAIVSLLVLAVVIFLLPPFLARVMIGLLIVAGAWEWGGLLSAGGLANRLLYPAFIAALLVWVLFSLSDPAQLENLFRVALGWWFLALLWMLFFPTRIPLMVGWLSGALVLVPCGAALDHLYLQSPRLLVFVLLIVWVADMGAYFVGKGFGRVKLAPKISPGKTWEGVLGGLTAVTVLAALASPLTGAKIGVLVPFCLAVAMISIVGDLTVSMFKRNAGVKDSGKLLPGHGGIMDRLDSVLVAVALGYYVVMALI